LSVRATGHPVWNRARATAAGHAPEARAPPATRSAPWRLCCPCALTKTRPYLLEAEAKKPFSSSHSPSLALLSRRATTLLCSVLCRVSSPTPQATIAPSDCVTTPRGAALITNLLGLAPGSSRDGSTTEAPKLSPVVVVEKNAPSSAHSGECLVQPPPHWLHLCTAPLHDHFAGHLDPSTGPAPSFPASQAAPLSNDSFR
jgi:hypothetical protein